MFERIKKFLSIEQEPQLVQVDKKDEFKIRPGFDIRLYRDGVPGPLLNLDVEGGKGLAEASRQTLILLRGSEYDYGEIFDNKAGMMFGRVCT